MLMDVESEFSSHHWSWHVCRKAKEIGFATVEWNLACFLICGEKEFQFYNFCWFYKN